MSKKEFEDSVIFKIASVPAGLMVIVGIWKFNIFGFVYAIGIMIVAMGIWGFFQKLDNKKIEDQEKARKFAEQNAKRQHEWEQQKAQEVAEIEQEQLRQKIDQEKDVLLLSDLVDDIKGAVRTLRSDKDNTAMQITIEESLKKISSIKNYREILKNDPEFIDDLRLCASLFQESGINDPFISKHLAKILESDLQGQTDTSLSVVGSATYGDENIKLIVKNS
ncbi:hypothetical protein K1718_27465 (plasmid) [Roseibium porphyridii]|uniref:Uncharacterized protein n=1 Tax=Roseibium porphyridii TaxID=2866279 RepID=A0ABY8FBD3_9HYPH|nr:hypothetical protein [Roseibium sp. KMA01]WFE92641.1 hypothetical protein K1718_27465 [Roseibium sp. KMA01]